MAIPFGIRRLDSLIGGGAPPGSTVLLVGEPGAGAREFLYTCAAMNGVAKADEDLFDLHYGDLHANADLPPDIHYLSFTHDGDFIRSEMRETMAAELAETAAPEISFHDLSPEFFQLSPIPREWYMGETQTVADLGGANRREEVLAAFGSELTENAPENLVLVDSVTDLLSGVGEDIEWTDVAMVMKGMTKVAHRWGGLIVLLVNQETLTDRQLGHFVDSVSGSLQFEWESGGSKRARTLFVGQFRGVLSRLEAENIVRFETEIHDAGFDVSDVRKIR
jgi:KaiC/GvpD/RAD55 family RecA-like ATPase